MKKARILIACLIVILAAQELGFNFPIFFEPSIEFAQEVSEPKETLFCQAEKKGNAPQRLITAVRVPTHPYQITHSKSPVRIVNRVILHRTLVI